MPAPKKKPARTNRLANELEQNLARVLRELDELGVKACQLAGAQGLSEHERKRAGAGIVAISHADRHLTTAKRSLAQAGGAA